MAATSSQLETFHNGIYVSDIELKSDVVVAESVQQPMLHAATGFMSFCNIARDGAKRHLGGLTRAAVTLSDCIIRCFSLKLWRSA